MAKDFSKSFYMSKAWKKCRRSYIAKRIYVDGGMCEECHKQLGYIIHHKIPLTPENISNPEITLGFGNLEYVCKDCHDRFEGHGVGRGSGGLICSFDENGQPVSLREIDRET